MLSLQDIERLIGTLVILRDIAEIYLELLEIELNMSFDSRKQAIYKIHK